MKRFIAWVLGVVRSVLDALLPVIRSDAGTFVADMLEFAAERVKEAEQHKDWSDKQKFLYVSEKVRNEAERQGKHFARRWINLATEMAVSYVKDAGG